MRSILAGFVTAAVVFLGLLALRPVPVAAARAGDDARAFQLLEEAIRYTSD